MSELSRYHTGINSCVSVSRSLHARLKVVASAQRWSMARIVDRVIIMKTDCSICEAKPGRRCDQEAHVIAYRAHTAKSAQ